MTQLLHRAGAATLSNTAHHLLPQFLVTFCPSSLLSNSFATTGSASCSLEVNLQCILLKFSSF